jgi:hypothetical protein
VRVIPRFVGNFFRFLFLDRFKSKIRLSPALLDFSARSGSADGHYFWQDLITARWIFEANPGKHFDVGSRIDGFIAHLLSFREVTVLDIREGSKEIPGLTTFVGDAQLDISGATGTFPSVSSLHSIEHFGLGRYGDQLDPQGHVKGLLNIARCVEVGGSFYVSFPLGDDVVEFNSQRLIHPNLITSSLSNFEVKSFVLIPWRGVPIFNTKIESINLDVHGQAGLFHLVRKS